MPVIPSETNVSPDPTSPQGALPQPGSGLIEHLRRSSAQGLPYISRAQKAQSFVELTLILPVLLLIFLGLTEAVIFMGRYLDILDLTREAARFASVRDPFAPAGAKDCDAGAAFDFYWDTACIFSPPANSITCTDPNFCNGLNSVATLDPAKDDVVVTIFTVNNNHVTNVWPSSSGWALSDNDNDPLHDANWTKDCQGHQIISSPHFTASTVESALQSGSMPNKGFVAIEFYYCYHQVLHIPFASLFVADPVRINAYTLMSLPAGAPSPTPN
jgi:TadE-like protein